MKSVGETLKAQRLNKKFSLDDVHKFIKIHPKFLRGLEEENYSVFSDEIHAKGFLKLYAEFLELDTKKLLALWRREYGAQFEKSEKNSKFKIKALEPARILITPGLVLSIVGAVLILGFFGYLFYQYRSYSGAPVLEIYSPENNIIVHSVTLDITGKTDRDSVLLINNQRVLLDRDGSFLTSLKLTEGLNTLNFLSVNKLGRETEETRTIIYRAGVVPIEAPEIESVEETTPSNDTGNNL